MVEKGGTVADDYSKATCIPPPMGKEDTVLSEALLTFDYMHRCVPTLSTGINIANLCTQCRAIFLSQDILQVLFIELIFPLLHKEEGQYQAKTTTTKNLWIKE